MTARTQHTTTTGRWVPFFFLAAIVAVLATLLCSATASAATTATAETRVGASSVVVEPLVGPPEHIRAGQRLREEPSRVIQTVATGVAAKTRKLDNVDGLPCNCFVAGTKVQTDNGEKPIEEIKVGDQVWAKDLDTGESQLRTVTGLFRKHADQVMTITTVDGATVTVTEEHPFYVDGLGWVMSGDLQVGDPLVQRDGGSTQIAAIDVRPVDTTVYNFTVEGDHNYYVTEAQLLVHNCSYVDLTRPGSIRNVGTDLSHTDFADNLTGAGWASRTSKDGSVQILERGGAKYTLRSHADTYAGWTAEFFPAGSSSATLKIRLGYTP